MIRPCYLAILGLAWLAGGEVQAYESFRCGNALIEVGTKADEVLKQCGSPTYERHASIERAILLKGGARRLVYDDADELLYDQGSGAFLRAAYVVDGAVARIEEFSRRGGLSPRPDGACFTSPNAVVLGDAALLLGYLCGEPVSHRVVEDDVSRHGGAVVRTELWLYNAPKGQKRVFVTADHVARMDP